MKIRQPHGAGTFLSPMIKRTGMSLLLCTSLAQANTEVSFKSDIAPILLEKCQSCHGPKKAKGNYRLDTFARALEPGAEELLYRVATDDEDERMPPESDPLEPAQIDLIKKWVAAGAKFDGKDPKASLASILPGVSHPPPPETYPRPIPVTALEFTPDNQHLLVSGYREVTIWSMENPSLTRRLQNLPERIHSIHFHPKDSNQIAIAGGIPGRLGEVRILDFTTGDILQTLHKSPDLCFSARYSPDGSQLATCGTDGTVRIFNTETWDEDIRFSNHSDWVNRVTWKPNGTQVASASRDHSAKVFDLVKKKRIATYTGHDRSVYAVHFHPTADHIIFSGAADGKFMRWRITDGKTEREYPKHPGTLYQITSLLPSRQLITASSNPFLPLYKLEDPGQRKHLGKDLPGTLSLAVSHDAQLIASGDRQGQVRIWKPTQEDSVLTFQAKP